MPTEEKHKTIDDYLKPCDKCGGKLTSGMFITESKKERVINLFAKCTECDWTEDPREEAHRPEKGVKKHEATRTTYQSS